MDKFPPATRSILMNATRGLLYCFGTLVIAGGLAALFFPIAISANFFLQPMGLAGAAEIRGFYGGSFIGFGIATLLGLRVRKLAPGVFTAMAIITSCAALARAVSIVLDHEIAFTLPAMILEVLLSAAFSVAGRAKLPGQGG